MPVNEACERLRVAVPEFFTVTVCVLVTPALTLPKLRLAGVTEMSGCTPVPLREIAAGELVAVLATLMLPDTLPADAGAKLTFSEKL